MAGPDTGQERTEKATPKRRESARSEGRVARSPELSSAVASLAGFVVLGAGGTAAIGAWTVRQLRQSVSLLSEGGAAGSGGMLGATREAALGTLAVLLPIGVTIVAATVGSGLAQTRGAMSFKPVAFRWSNVDPAAGFRRMLGSEAAISLLRSLAKLAAIGTVAWMAMAAARPELMALAGAGPGGLAAVLKTLSFRLALTTGIAFLVIAIGDYAWRWYQHEKSLRMTRQEVVREHRETEGDPLVRARQQSLARARARQRMLQNVRHADVVVTNPTHVAVALRYDLDKAPAPVVLAMGQRKLAQRIKELARRHSVPVIENPPVARALLATAQVGKPIPAAMYAAIAEILAWVYRQRGRLPGGGRLHPDGAKS